MVLRTSTSCATLPSRMRPSPRRPWEAMTIRSQSFFLAASKMPSAGCFPQTCNVEQATSLVFAASHIENAMRRALSPAPSSYACMTDGLVVDPPPISVYGSVTVAANTLALSALADQDLEQRPCRRAAIHQMQLECA